jgi:hypothetical protein
MIRMIFGVIVGFVAWSILWVGSDQVFAMMSDWYRGQNDAMILAMANE